MKTKRFYFESDSRSLKTNECYTPVWLNESQKPLEKEYYNEREWKQKKIKTGM